MAANLFLGHEQTAGGWAGCLPPSLRPLRGLDMEEQSRDAVAKLNVPHPHLGADQGSARSPAASARRWPSRARCAPESTVVLLDEPTAALGVAQTAQMLDVVRQLRENRHAVIYVSHNLRDVFAVCDRITVLRHGARVGVSETEATTPDEIVVAITRGGEGDETAADAA